MQREWFMGFYGNGIEFDLDGLLEMIVWAQ